MGNALKYLVENGERVSAYVLLLLMVAALGYICYAFAFGKLPTPGDYKRLQKAHDALNLLCDESDKVLDVARQELADARVLHAAAVVRIEFLESETRRRESELSEFRARIARLEAELDVRRSNEWRKQVTSQEEGR